MTSRNLKIFAVLAALVLTSQSFAQEAPTPGQVQRWYDEAFAADTGQGGKQDEAAAFELYLKAANAGHAAAMRNLAGMYGSGRGVGQDDDEARRWFRSAAEAGDAQGQFALGWYYSADRDEKLTWLRMAAAQGHKEAVSRLKGMGEPLVAETQATPEPAAPEMAEPVNSVQPAALEVPMPAAIAAMCVQRQLISAGYDIGAIDGQIGRRTRAAAVELAAALGLADLPALGAETAEQWCRALPTKDPKLQPFLTKAIADATLATKDYGPVGGMRYDIASDVPLNEVDVVKTGMSLADDFVARNIGGGIPEANLKKITVKIVATGKGNQERGGGGAAATAYSGPTPRPFFDVKHPQWNQNSSNRGWTTAADSTKTAAHEYIHIWQGHLGGLSGVFQPLDGWVNEGIAEYLAYRTMVDAGLMPWDRVRPFVLNGALADQLKEPLDTLQSRPVWPGHAGFLAIDWLVDETPNGLMSLRIVADEIKNGRSPRKAFRTAFGLELADFYAQFEVWREALVADRAALDRRPALNLAGASAAPVAEEFHIDVTAEPGLLLYILMKDAQNRVIHHNKDGTREQAPGLYSLSVPADVDLTRVAQVCAIRFEPPELFDTGQCFDFDGDAPRAGALRLALPPPPGR